MDEAKRQLVQNWLLFAQRDLGGARKLATAPDAYLEIALYHCQQSAEKAVKAFLICHDRRFEKTHDIAGLVLLATSIDERFSAWMRAGRLLTPYASEFRYPEDRPVAEAKEFEQAWKAAKEFYGFVLSVLPAEVHPPQECENQA
jgi:HEPN domain-containing protein